MIKLCDVVMNTIHFDPRVNRQIEMYLKSKDIQLSCVGLMDNKYSEERLKKYPFEVNIVQRIEKYNRKMRTPIGKLIREIKINQRVCDAIIAQNPDIIHANDLDALIPAMKAASKLGSKIIYDSHEIYVDNLWVSRKKIYKLYLQFLEKKLVKKVDLMVCVSNAAANYFERKYKIKKPLVITNCAFSREESVAVEQKNSGFEILIHGQYHEGRGYDILIETIPYLANHPEIKIALRGYGSMEKTLKDRAKILGEENVRFYPKVQVEELIPMAAKSHVGVAITESICLNFELSVSNKLFEYASVGLPVILSNIPEHRYLNENYKFGIVLSDNKPETLAAAIIKLYSDRNFYNECSNNALKLSKEINWENEFNKLINIVRQMFRGVN